MNWNNIGNRLLSAIFPQPMAGGYNPQYPPGTVYPPQPWGAPGYGTVAPPYGGKHVSWVLQQRLGLDEDEGNKTSCHQESFTLLPYSRL
ncbi:hypothetical protein PFLUV_G00141940 [Perca fluviatilis]|uniref:Uncharacterized protein n=1 Tax=Perca fluviatilis TaxID=8168 RepID=A0A6A5EIP1_PERFL|nr:hypothetical protein PFLUV_G00141940 [Perca fluviatilis]